MHLSPREIDKLLLHNAGFLAQQRLARGVRLNHPEAVALIAAQLLEFIRDGKSVAELMEDGEFLVERTARWSPSAFARWKPEAAFTPRSAKTFPPTSSPSKNCSANSTPTSCSSNRAATTWRH